MDKIKILIADDIAETRKLICRLLEMSDEFEVVGEVENGKEVLDYVKVHAVDMVLMDINMPVLNGLEATRALSLERPEIIVVIMSVQSENEYLKKAMLVGAKEYIIKPFNFEVLINTLVSTYREYSTRVHSKPLVAQQKKAKVISLFSAKGGSGKTFLAAQLCHILSQKNNLKVLAIDADYQFGDLGLVLGQKLSPTIIDLLSERNPTSEEVFSSNVLPVSKNFDILLAPSSPEQAEGLPKEGIENILIFAKEYYDVIICDIGLNYSDISLMLLDHSDRVLIVTLPLVNAIHHTKKALEIMKSLDYTPIKVKLVANQMTKQTAITQKEIETVLNHALYASIPEDIISARDAINQGNPQLIAKGFSSSKLYRSLVDLVKHLTKELEV
jgi:pilus assembly protein CpaE